jgi:hypothetical protein
MTSDKSFFSELHETDESVFLADDSCIAVKGVGHGELTCITPAKDDMKVTL